MTTVKKYDRLNRLELIESQPSADNPISYAYGYNQANQRTNAVLADGTSWVYEYDDLGQVTVGKKVGRNGRTLDGYDFRYAYDDIGNRRKSIANGEETDYQADALNRYTSVAKRDGAKPEEVATHAYDEDGNLKADGVWLYTWDAENRLIAMTSAASVAQANQKSLEFGYDTQSRRIRKSVCEKGVGSEVGRPSTNLSFIYDGWDLIAELDERAHDHSPAVTYVWGLDMSGSIQGAGGVGGLLASRRPDRSAGRMSSGLFHAYDGNGNLVCLAPTDLGGAVIGVAYGPFADRIPADTALISTPFGFSTKHTDLETSLAAYGYRYYSRTAGAWLSRDPIEEQGGLNVHALVGNDPVNFVDAFGLWSSLPAGGTHETLTRDALNTVWTSIQNPPNAACRTRIADALVDANAGQDIGAASKDFSRHFNRTYFASETARQVQQRRTDARYDYEAYIQAEEELFDFTPSCWASLSVLGRLSHSWQDYYAHGIHPTQGFADPITGSPTSFTDFWPSSYNTPLPFYPSGEHPNLSEPVSTASQRYAQAEAYVAFRFRSMLGLWLGGCKCICEQ